jgi:hypothetical protein
MQFGQLAGVFINILHTFFVLFVLFGILSNDPMFLLLYLFTLISLLLHWLMNNDICCLTLTERMLTGRTNDESFIHQIVSPIYKIPNQHLAYLSKIVVYILIGLTLIKLYRMGLTPRKYYDIISNAFKQLV